MAHLTLCSSVQHKERGRCYARQEHKRGTRATTTNVSMRPETSKKYRRYTGVQTNRGTRLSRQRQQRNVKRWNEAKGKVSDKVLAVTDHTQQDPTRLQLRSAPLSLKFEPGHTRGPIAMLGLYEASGEQGKGAESKRRRRGSCLSKSCVDSSLCALRPLSSLVTRIVVLEDDFALRRRRLHPEALVIAIKRV